MVRLFSREVISFFANHQTFQINYLLNYTRYIGYIWFQENLRENTRKINKKTK